MIGGKIADAFGYDVMFYFCMGLLLIGLIGFLLYDRGQRSRKDA